MDSTDLTQNPAEVQPIQPEMPVEASPFDHEECFKRFKKFQSRALSGDNGYRDRVRHEKSFLAGKQWDTTDDKFIAKSRNRITVNVIRNQCNSVANQYAAYPFTWAAGDQVIDKEIDEFFKIDANRFAAEEALQDLVNFGRGVIAIGSDVDAGGTEVPVIYAITNPDRVLLDPDSTELDGGDMMEAALIDYRSREWIRVNMGEQYLPGKREKMVCTCASCATLVPIITYYWLDTDGCHTATFVNETYSEGSHDVLSLHRIPVFPCYGEKTWEDGDADKETYQGLIAKSETVQRIVNYAMTQLIERLALSPKAQWKGYAESFKDLDKYYKRAGTGENSIIPGNRLANDGTTTLPLPERVDNTVQFQDVQGIVQGTMGMLSSITGVDSKGLADVEQDITATAVLYTAKVFQSNIRHFFSHLRTSFKALGDTLMSLMGHPGVRVEVVQGPEEYMENQTTLQVLMQLMPNADPAVKPKFIQAALRTQPRNAVLADLYVELNRMNLPSPGELEAQQTMETMRQAIEQKDAQLLQLQQQVQGLTRQISDQKASFEFELVKQRQAHEFKMAEMALQAQLSQGGDAIKAQAEADKAVLSAEQQATKLAEQRMKLTAEAMKLTGGVPNVSV